MSLAWCMIAVSFLGANDPKFGTPPPPSGQAPVVNQANVREPQERWPMDLAAATHIAFDNSEHFRVVEFGVCGLDAYFPLHKGGPITIARLNADTPVAQLKADAMALVRSIEQNYWNLAQAQVALESAEHAVRMTQELLEKAQAKITLSRGGLPLEVIEAAQRLEQFNGDLTTRRADVVAAERALRKVLGLPPSDNRRINTTTKLNISLAALSEAKGTLLADRNIVAAEGPKRVRPLQIAQKTPGGHPHQTFASRGTGCPDGHGTRAGQVSVDGDASGPVRRLQGSLLISEGL